MFCPLRLPLDFGNPSFPSPHRDLFFFFSNCPYLGAVPKGSLRCSLYSRKGFCAPVDAGGVHCWWKPGNHLVRCMKRAGRGWEADTYPYKDSELGGMFFFFPFQSGSFFSQVSSSICKVSKARRSSTWRSTWGVAGRGTRDGGGRGEPRGWGRAGGTHGGRKQGLLQYYLLLRLEVNPLGGGDSYYEYTYP